MNRIDEMFQRKPEKILSIYMVAGYPEIDSVLTVIPKLEHQGVDLIEVGMPYSDPLADGVVIQEAGTQALANGMHLALLFEQLAAVRKQVKLPLILMGYYNQVLQYGVSQFLERAKQSGVDGFILPDLPPAVYERQLKPIFEQMDLGISFLVTPQTPEDRIRWLDSLCRGFLYVVSSAGTTGVRGGFTEEQVAYFQKLRNMGLKCPRLIGFGIGSMAMWEEACGYAQGGIIGSAYVKARAIQKL